MLPGDWCLHRRLLYWGREGMFGLYLALSEIAFDANGVTLGVLHKAVEKATYPGIEIAPPPQS